MDNSCFEKKEIELTMYHSKISSVFEIAVARLPIFKVSISTLRFVFLFFHLSIREGTHFYVKLRVGWIQSFHTYSLQ